MAQKQLLETFKTPFAFTVVHHKGMPLETVMYFHHNLQSDHMIFWISFLFLSLIGEVYLLA